MVKTKFSEKEAAKFVYGIMFELEDNVKRYIMTQGKYTVGVKNNLYKKIDYTMLWITLKNHLENVAYPVEYPDENYDDYLKK